MKITFEEIKRLEKLSALSSNEDKLKNLVEDFEEIAKFVEQVKDADISSEMEYIRTLKIDELRKDEIKASMPQEEILANAPEIKDGAFVVPKVVD